MAKQRPKRLPTDFFDRLLSNQTDDQMNDLLTSIVDEQITPTAEPPADSPPPPEALPAKSLRQTIHHDKIEDSIVTRDETLDEEPITGEQESPLDDLIPRTTRMQAPGPRAKRPPLEPRAPVSAAPPEAAVIPPQVPPAPPKARIPGLESLEMPPEHLDAAPSAEPPAREEEVPTEDAGVSRVVSAPPPGVHGAPEDWQAGMPAPPEMPLPPEEAVAAEPTVLPEEPAAEPPVRARPEAPPEAPAAAAETAPIATDLAHTRIQARWQRSRRKPKLPKMAKHVDPIVVLPPKVDQFNVLFGDLSRTKERFVFNKMHRAALVFLLPGFIAFSLFSWYPMLKGLFISFYDYHPTGISTFIGFQNYARAFYDVMFWRTLAHAGWFCFLVLLLGFWLPILLSVFINELRLGRGLFKFVFFLPFLMPTVPAAILWKWIMDQGFGILNALIALLPIADPHIGWLTDPRLALFSIVMVYIWKNTGWAILIYSAALGNIDETMYEEAEIDGASLWDKIKIVTFPAMRTVVSVMLIITIINTLQLFTEIYIMTNGGPMNSTEVIATYIYKQAFFYMDIGYASALSILLLLMLLFITIFRLRRLEPGGG